MGILIDTSALVDLLRRREQLTGSLPDEIVDIYIPAIVLAEIWIGIELAPNEEIRKGRLQEVRELLEGSTVIPFSEDLAPVYARLYVQLRKSGTPIPANDLAIASTAIHYDHDLLVGKEDEGHFRKIPGLKVRTL
jgi:tRNA(fMet)-specific endonuclease VapC